MSLEALQASLDVGCGGSLPLAVVYKTLEMVC